MRPYKITIEDLESKKEFHFYSLDIIRDDDNYDEYSILSGKFFTSSIFDAKSAERYTIKDKIVEALKD